MTVPTPFDLETDRYDRWFERNEETFRAEVTAIESCLCPSERSVEIGVGTGRFARALSVRYGVDPSRAMLERARRRRIRVVRAVAEALPFQNAAFDVGLMTTTVCFLDSLPRAFDELRRVLRPGGQAVIAMVDRESWLGRRYATRSSESPFYAGATFRTPAEVEAHLRRAGFDALTFTQTLFEDAATGGREDSVRSGYGAGGFVVICGRKRSAPSRDRSPARSRRLVT